MSVEAPPILWHSISKRMIVLISNMSDSEGSDSVDLPKVICLRNADSHLCICKNQQNFTKGGVLFS